jgi:hypothetical protein
MLRHAQGLQHSLELNPLISRRIPSARNTAFAPCLSPVIFTLSQDPRATPKSFQAEVREALRQGNAQKESLSTRTREFQKHIQHDGVSSVHRPTTASVWRTARHAAQPRENLSSRGNASTAVPTAADAPTADASTTVCAATHAAKHLRQRHSSGLIATGALAS